MRCFGIHECAATKLTNPLSAPRALGAVSLNTTLCRRVRRKGGSPALSAENLIELETSLGPGGAQADLHFAYEGQTQGFRPGIRAGLADAAIETPMTTSAFVTTCGATWRRDLAFIEQHRTSRPRHGSRSSARQGTAAGKRLSWLRFRSQISRCRRHLAMLAVGLSDGCTGSAPRLKARAECVTLWREKVRVFGCGKLSS